MRVSPRLYRATDIELGNFWGARSGATDSGVRRQEPIEGTYKPAGCPRVVRDANISGPKAITTKIFYDDLGRRTATVENYKAGSDYWTVEPLQPKTRAAGRRGQRR